MKTTKFRRPLQAFASAVLFTYGNAVHASVILESADAGQLTTTAQSIAGTSAIDAIRGSLLTSSSVDYADVFRVYLQNGSQFSATTTGSTITYNNFDTSLFLFNSAGMGLVANDDDPSAEPKRRRADRMDANRRNRDHPQHRDAAGELQRPRRRARNGPQK